MQLKYEENDVLHLTTWAEESAKPSAIIPDHNAAEPHLFHLSLIKS